MRHAAVEFAWQSRDCLERGAEFDVLFCTDMLNLAEFRGLAPAPLNRLKTLVYFHENQFEYPNREDRERDLHFAFTNLTTALAADAVWFNSRFNRDSMSIRLKSQLKRWPDFRPEFAVHEILAKAAIQSPGIDISTSAVCESESAPAGRPLHLIWAARWEHDKNPRDLLLALEQVSGRGVDFELSVLGESFRNVPAEFETIRQQFADQIVHWGYLESRQDYRKVLRAGDVFLSTALHEFFGIAAAEAIAEGLFPLLPNRLAYPELLKIVSAEKEVDRYLYDGSPTDLARCIQELSATPSTWTAFRSDQLAANARKRLNWERRRREMDAAIETVVAGS